MNEPGHGIRRLRPHKRWHWIVLIVVALVLVALLARVIAGSGGPKRQGRMPAPVAVAKVVYGDVPVTVSGLGTVTPLVTAVVRSQQSGNLVKIEFQEGQRVRKNQQLALVDPRPFVLQQSQAQANLAHDQALLATAKLDLQRYETLLKQDSIARQTTETQRQLVKQYEGTVAADRAALGTAKLNLTYTSVKSPVDGRIGLRQTDIGNYVTPGDTNGIATVTQMDPMDVVFTLPQAQLAEIQGRMGPGANGLAVTATDQNGTTTLAEGKLLTFDNTIDTTTGTVKAKARFANAGWRLIPNEFVNISMLTNTLRHVLIVPVSAVRHGAPGDFVFVLNGDRTVSLKVVKIGPSVGNNIAILSGLTGDETVVVAGADGLEDGSKVRLPGDKAGPGAGSASPGDGSSDGAKKGHHKHHGQSADQG